MEARFRELLSEAVSVAEEYRLDFGGALKPPSPVTAFRYKRSGKVKKAVSKPSVKTAPPSESKTQEKNPKTARLIQRLGAAKKKLEAAKTAGQPTRPLEDRVYEIEDALRLSRQTV
jgi:hypothetical protein